MYGSSDPGWGAPWRVLLRIVLLPARTLLTAGMGARAPIVVLREVLLSFVAFVLLIAVVVAVLVGSIESSASLGPTIALLAVGAVAIVGLVGAELVSTRPLDCTSDSALLQSYRQQLFLQYAAADLGACVGFVAFILSGEGWVYGLGAAGSLATLIRVAPTARRLEMAQERVASQGCGRSLVALLYTEPEG